MSEKEFHMSFSWIDQNKLNLTIHKKYWIRWKSLPLTEDDSSTIIHIFVWEKKNDSPLIKDTFLNYVKSAQITKYKENIKTISV